MSVAQEYAGLPEFEGDALIEALENALEQTETENQKPDPRVRDDRQLGPEPVRCVNTSDFWD